MSDRTKRCTEMWIWCDVMWCGMVRLIISSRNIIFFNNKLFSHLSVIPVKAKVANMAIKLVGIRSLISPANQQLL